MNPLAPVVPLALTLMSACSWSWSPEPKPDWPVHEAYDVPPPPGSVSLDLGPIRTRSTFALGAAVTLERDGRRVPAEVLDVQHQSGGVVITVYADAAGAAPWVSSATPVSVRISPRAP